MDEGRLAELRNGARGEILFADPRRRQTAQRRERKLEASVRGDPAGDADGGVRTMSWIQRLWQRNRLERELDKEVRFHLERQIQDLIAAGVAPREAQRQAKLLLGGVEQTKEACRDARG